MSLLLLPPPPPGFTAEGELTLGGSATLVPGLFAGGHITLGGIGLITSPLGRQPVGTLGSHYENVVLDDILGSGTPTDVWVILFNQLPPGPNGTGIEVSQVGTGYSPVMVVNNSTNWPAAFNSQKRNGLNIGFGTPLSVGWDVIQGYGIYDDAVLRTPLHMVCFGAVTPTLIKPNSYPVQFSIGNLVITAT